MRHSLKVNKKCLLLDLGEICLIETQYHFPRLAQRVVVLPDRQAACYDRLVYPPALQKRLLESGIPLGGNLIYTLPVDPFDFEQEGDTLCLPGLRIYLAGAPEFVESPWYAYVRLRSGKGRAECA
ncbi:hypothetical protein [Meiothermus rufus]|uniref:hypothetical protein n=1 Tax=Meiothermus rufus TaxID=604332 RepID=UPI0004020238|nr:hypothetical protein [Meiothermus rufus]